MIHRMIVLSILLLATAASAAADPEIPSLKRAFEGDFLVGTALNRNQIMGRDPAILKLVTSQFNQVTAENVMKWEKIEPREGEFDWTAADALVDFAERNDMQVAGHVLVWHQQTPAWVFEGADGAPASREQLLSRMREHIEAVVSRYKGRVRYWEVVNEALNEDGSLRRSPWLEGIGEDYIEKAFEFAHRADPEAILYYNDYNLYKPTKRAGAVRLVQGLIEKGAPVGGIGMQAHYGMDHPANLGDFEASIEAFAALGMPVHITEMDISVLPMPGPEAEGADLDVDVALNRALNPYAGGLPADVTERQASRYEAIFRILLAHRKDVARVTFWGVDDGQSWKNDWPVRGRTDYPLLFDRDGQPKAAFYALIRSSYSK